MKAKPAELPVLTLKSQKSFELWLKKKHKKSAGVWLRFFKKDSGKKAFHYAEALDAALCYGWIDSQANSYDEESYIQKFTPRRPKSIWSKRNKAHVARLLKEKRIAPAGLAQIEAAKKDGRWDGAYDPSSTMKVPDDFLKELKKDKKAYAFFLTLDKANVYAIGWRLQTAKKPETRARRMDALLAMMKEGKKLH